MSKAKKIIIAAIAASCALVIALGCFFGISYYRKNQITFTVEDTLPDGNGRVGRLIAFKECLRFNIVPFIIEDSKKMFYYRGLKEWNHERGFLIETCLDGQDTYKTLLNYFDIE